MAEKAPLPPLSGRPSSPPEAAGVFSPAAMENTNLVRNASFEFPLLGTPSVPLTPSVDGPGRLQKVFEDAVPFFSPAASAEPPSPLIIASSGKASGGESFVPEVKVPTLQAVPSAEKVEVDPELKDKLQKQVEFYFSDQNLPTDNFLMKHIKKNAEGFVPLKVIANFRKVKQLTTNVAVIASALRDSADLILSEDGKKVRRAAPLPEVNVHDIQARTLVAENLPENPTIGSIEQLFSKAGKVLMVRICQPNAANGATQTAKSSKEDMIVSNKVHALVEYETAQQMEKACEMLTDHDNWRTGLHVRPLLRGGARKQQKQDQQQQKTPPKQRNDKTPPREPDQTDDNQSETKAKRNKSRNKSKTPPRRSSGASSEGLYTPPGTPPRSPPRSRKTSASSETSDSAGIPIVSALRASSGAHMAKSPDLGRDPHSLGSAYASFKKNKTPPKHRRSSSGGAMVEVLSGTPPKAESQDWRRSSNDQSWTSSRNKSKTPPRSRPDTSEGGGDEDLFDMDLGEGDAEQAPKQKANKSHDHGHGRSKHGHHGKSHHTGRSDHDSSRLFGTSPSSGYVPAIPKGPRMPDGTRGFAAGRGRPMAPPLGGE